MIEVHVTFDRAMFGPDVTASLTFEELAELVRARDAFYEMDAHPVDKDEIAESLRKTRETFGKSVAPARPLSAGTRLTREMLTFKKPASGISADALDSLIGRRLARDVGPARLLRWEDLDADT